MPVDDQALGGVSHPPHRAAAVDFARKATVSLAPVFKASGAVFSDRLTGDVHFVNWPAWCRNHYCRYVRDRDPIRRWLDSADMHHGGGVVRLSDIAAGVALRRMPFADTLMTASGARFVLTIALRRQSRVVGAFSLVREVGAADFDAADCERARSLLPILELAYSGAVHGQPRFAAASASRGMDLLCALTPREREVAALAAAGHGNKAIARMVGASPWTVKNHLRAVFEKTGVHSRTALARAIE